MFRDHPRLYLGGLSVLCGLLVLLGAGVGAVSISPTSVVGVLLGLEGTHTPQQAAVLTMIRLPRVLLGLLVGAGLAVSGALMQGLFRNPLADPGLVGISSGAALAAALTLVLGGAWAAHPAVLPIAAFVGGSGVTLLVMRLARHSGQRSVTAMLLAGIAVNAVAAAGTGVLVTLSSDAQLRSLTFWTLGSLGGATWDNLRVVSSPILLAVLGAPWLAHPLNALLLGEEEAIHLGISVERLKQLIVALVALCVGACVALTGIIGFVGLAAPHLVRLTVGADHRWLLPASALLGAGLLMGADVVARTVIAPAELPIGVVTTLLGGPLFLSLLARRS